MESDFVIDNTELQGFLSKVSFHLSGLAGPINQPLNVTHEFSKLILLMDQSRSVLPLRSAKARELGELWREKCTRAPWSLPFKLARTSSFNLGQPDRTDEKQL